MNNTRRSVSQRLVLIARRYWWLGAIWLVCVAVWSYRVSDFLFFGFEQGRDALAAMQIAQLSDFVLVGPKTDIAGIFHGVWYYYFLAVVYGLGGGSPVVASGVLIGLTSLVVVAMGWFMCRLTGQVKWGVTMALGLALSLELAQYSRWLSNVTPAVLGTTLVWLAWWQYRQSRDLRWWIGAAFLAGFAAQFQIILTLWFGTAAVLLLATTWLPWPKWRGVIAGIVAAGVWYVPWVVFNVRNGWISIQASRQYVAESGGGFDLFSAVQGYSLQLQRVIEVNVFLLPRPWPMIGSLLVVLGLWLVARQRRWRPAVSWLGAWWLMTWPVIFFSRSLNLPQLYVGTGIAAVGLAVLAAAGLWRDRGRWARGLALVLSAMMIIGWGRAATRLLQNRSLFFITIQDDLNLKDQRQLLEYVHSSSQGRPYRLKAFAIPYYQEEGWLYLHDWYYGPIRDDGAELIYVVIEKNVDPHWIEQWTADLGQTSLVEERRFGLLRVQQRQKFTE